MKPSTYRNTFWENPPVPVTLIKPMRVYVIPPPGISEARFFAELTTDLGETLAEKANIAAENGIFGVTLVHGAENRIYESLKRFGTVTNNAIT